MDVLPRQNDRRAVAPARKASSPVFVPPSFMPASGILQQQLKKMSLGAGEAVAARAPPAFCRRGTPVREPEFKIDLFQSAIVSVLVYGNEV